MVNIEGTCSSGFEAVQTAFAANFTEKDETGAAVCVTIDGETVVDLWGGVADVATGRPWDKDTIGVVWSCTKGATALCAHVLADRGLLDIHAPVADYWPEFAANGKQEVTVAMVLSHQAGLAAFREPLPPGGMCDWAAVTEQLARMDPFWEPGTRHGYHAFTFGFLIGEVVRRITGRSLGTFFREEIAEPLGLDFWIGLPASLEERVAPTIIATPPGPDEPVPSFIVRGMSDPTSVQGYQLFNNGDYLAPGGCDTRDAHAAEIPAANGITNARSLASMYRPLALDGSFGGVRIVSPEALGPMSAVASASSCDALALITTRFSLGFMKHLDNRHRAVGDRDSVLLSDAAFGHAGAGGSLGFADPPARLSFGYTMNRQGPGTALNERGQRLVDSVYTSLGFVQGRDGAWQRPPR